MNNLPTHVDLFSGIGGFALAAKWAGFKTIQFVEKDEFCKKVLKKHWPDVALHDDIKTFNFTHKIDLLTGGFPCQPFSVAGKKKGINDDRYLWPEVARIIRASKPAWFIGENVPGIIPSLDPILEDLEREGYASRTFIIPASTVNAPHKRERIWIVANRNSERCDERDDNRKKRYIQIDWKQHIEEIQSEWTQFQPQSWTTFNAQEWLEFASDTHGINSNKRTKNNVASTKRSQWAHTSSTIITHKSTFNWEENKPPIPGVDDGLPNGLDRNRSLGNAIVPQVIYPILKMIYVLNQNSEKENEI
jgi:DNA (cytosine-5)-methyltransferase 1